MASKVDSTPDPLSKATVSYDDGAFDKVDDGADYHGYSKELASPAADRSVSVSLSEAQPDDAHATKLYADVVAFRWPHKAVEPEYTDRPEGSKLFNHFPWVLPGPPQVRNIIFSELCERFTYYSTRSTLNAFLRFKLGYVATTAITTSLWTQGLVYFTPVIGGILADSLLGRFNTIVLFSVIYVFGTTTLCLSAVYFLPWLCMLGLSLIALGSGGIKPNISVFGAEQFLPLPDWYKRDKTNSYFSWFYFCINVGALGAFLAVPAIRGTDVHTNDGYWHAWIIPVCLFATALFVIVLPFKKYVRTTPQGSTLVRVVQVTASAVAGLWRQRGSAAAQQREHWLDAAVSNGQQYTELDIVHAKALWRIMPMYSLVILQFIFYNTASAWWENQAYIADYRPFTYDQITSLNPVLILILIPLYDRIIYPAFKRSGRPLGPLNRIFIGFCLYILSSIVGSVVASLMDSSAGCSLAGRPTSVASLNDSYGLSLTEASSVPLCDSTLLDPSDIAHKFNVFIQLPGYVLQSAGEIMVNITLLDFSYAIAPAAMKSSITACYLVTQAVGSLATSPVYAAVAYGTSNTPLSSANIGYIFSGLQGITLILWLVMWRYYRAFEKLMVHTDAEKLQNETLSAVASAKLGVDPAATTTDNVNLSHDNTHAHAAADANRPAQRV